MSEIERLREFLKRHNMTQADLARRLGYSPVYLNKIFCGAEPLTDKVRYSFVMKFGYESAAVVFGSGKDGGQ